MAPTSERELFDACLDLPEAERVAWLEAHCADAALRERVLRLLNAHGEAEAGRGFPSGIAAAGMAERRIGPYRILEHVGEGAIGDVYLAEQTAPVVRRVALKVIKPGMDSREVIARFEVERQTLAIMSHPNIAQIYDAGTTSEGRPYFAMEYVPGMPLTAYCESQRLDLPARLALFLAICDGVQHAHQKGVIHRDLKPSNLLVAERDGHPAPKIIDFGVAKATTPTLQKSDAHTRIGQLVGTPEYMSPEQAQLSPLDIDTRSDVYSLGVVLYQLLVGSLPYRLTGDTATPAQIMSELLATDVRAPSQTLRRDRERAAAVAAQCASTPRQHLHEIQGELDWIVMKALEKDRNRRYGSVAELAADVRRYLANEPVLAGPPSTIYRLRKLVARHQAWAVAIAMLFLATAAFGAVMALQARELARQRDDARFQAARAEASSEFMSLMLEEVGTGGRPITMVELLDAGVGLLDRRYPDDPRFVGHMLLQMSRRYEDLQNTGRQLGVLARAESIARSLKDDELLARVDCAMMASLVDANDTGQATARLEEAKRAIARIESPSVELQVDCLRAEAEFLKQEPGGRAARAALERARALLESSGSTRGLPYTSTLTDLGYLHFIAGEFREALELNRLTGDAFERNGRGGTLGMIITISNRGQLYYRLGEIRRAEELGRESLDRLRTLRQNEPLSPAQSIAYATTLVRLNRTEEAERILTGAMKQSSADKNEYLVARAALERGRALLALGRVSESEADFRAAEKYWIRDPAGNRDRLAELEYSRAALDLSLGRTEQARARIGALLAKVGYPERRDTPILAPALRTAARIELSGGEHGTAERYAQHALELAEAVARDPAQSADVGEALLLRGLAQRAAHTSAEAEKSFERAVISLANGLGQEHPLTLEALNAAG